ncbi:MAG: hypothetical protein HZT43_01960 [Exiguobacterium profundum]|nr:MAG: hypothetical protein HZT43_01960 [Exiguobacterium profundum]
MPIDLEKLKGWYLNDHITVENAAILLADGDPDEVDSEVTRFGDVQEYKRTTGHPGYTAMFEAITNAIRTGNLKAILAFRTSTAEDDLFLHERPCWLLCSDDVRRLREVLPDDALSRKLLRHGNNIRVEIDPDWARSLVSLKDIREWLSAKGRTTGFPFAQERPWKPSTDIETMLDPEHPHFSPELSMAIAAWRGLREHDRENQATKNAIRKWIKAHPEEWKSEDELSESAVDRIATIVNWRKAGGAPKSG